MVMRVLGLRSRHRFITSSMWMFAQPGKEILCFSSVMACSFWMKGSAAKGVVP